jgi:AcrR family transcriptional regulator
LKKPKSQATQQAVLEAAIKAFARRGYARTSVDAIAEATGLSKPTLYYYFENKADLFRAILAYAYDECYRLMSEAALGRDSAAAQLAEVAAALFGFVERHADLMRLVLSTVYAAPGELPPRCIDPAKRRRNFELVLQIVAGAQKAGELKAGYDSAEIAHGILGALSHQIRAHLLDPSEPLNRRRGERIVSLFLEGARAES